MNGSLWSRFRTDRWALAGLIVVGIVALACVAAPWIAPDPTEMRAWVGAQPPFSRVPAAPERLVLTVGQPPPLPASDSLVIELDPGNARWRAAMRRGLLQLRSPDARLADSLLVPSGSVLESPGDVEAFARPGLIRAGTSPPAWLVDAAQPVRYLRLPGGTVQLISARVADGVVVALERDGQVATSLNLRGEQIRSIVADGRAQTAFHLLGSDLQGRDLWARTLHGGRISLLVGVVATAVSLLIGVLYGAIAGWRGGRVDVAMVGMINVLDALPFLFLVILLMTLVGSNIYVLFAALGAVQWLTTARIVRAQVMSLASADFIAAARCAGLPPWRIVVRHLVPSCIGPVIVFAALTVPAVILEESFLAFIGLQVQTSEGLALDSWGALVAQGMAALGTDGARSWLLLVPAGMMTATLLALNLVGDGLRAALDPRLARMAR